MPPSTVLRALSRLPRRSTRPSPCLRCYKTAPPRPNLTAAGERPPKPRSEPPTTPAQYPTTSVQSDPANHRSTVFTELDVLDSVPAPASSVETIFEDGFLLNNGVHFRDGSGVLLVHNEAFKWRPEVTLRGGVVEFGDDAWGMLEIVTPKPELLIVGMGKKTCLLARKDRDKIMDLGIRVDVMDTVHAAGQYNLLATERPMGQIAAALLVEEFGATT